ncbi:MAG: beta-ketoacyl-ACP synthase II [Archangiaceae bacterium]|nr:beta-ketoacyl-ACP synthase II [Archangiaceae bacterium]
MRRVVVTGMGVVSPLGVGVGTAWGRLLDGKSGIQRITGFDVTDLPAKIAGQVPRGKGPGELDLEAHFDHQERRRLEDFIVFAIAATEEALAQAGWRAPGEEEQLRTGVLLGSGVGGLPGIAETAVTLNARGPRKVSPFFIPTSLINEASGLVSMRFGFKGPVHSVVTACSTGANAIGDAARMIGLEDADVMVAGGAEAATCRLALAGFAAMRALSTGYNDTPEAASRPWDKARDGFVLGEGAGVMVLEEREHALKRGATVLAEVTGYGMAGDAYHLSAPDPKGQGALRAMRAALKRAQLDPGQLDYVNAHATSTPVGDPIELHALRELLGAGAGQVSVSSTKSATGHLLGAAGAVEAVFAVQALQHQVAPPTLNLHEPENGAGFDLVPLTAKERRIEHVLSNSFGFGGTNASLVFSRA